MNDTKELSDLYSKASAYCSKSEKCISEVKQFLFKHSENNNLINDLIRILIQEKYIDEHRYANAYVNDKFKFSGWGKIKISFMLRQKNIPNDIIINSIELIDEEKYFDFVKDLLSKKTKTIRNKDHEQIKVGLIRFGTSRGFELDVVLKAIKSIKF